jgi:mannose-6-phosphate isomerase-like protein (cupin superfamily)
MQTQPQVTAKVFTFLSDEILDGVGDVILPGTDGLSGVVKRYVDGGENEMHCHSDQDHVFYVLQGQVMFHLEREENVVVVNQHDAVLLPRMAYYWFKSTGDEKLIMLRVSNSKENRSRLYPDGTPIPSYSSMRDAGRTDSRPHAPARDLPF